MIAVFARDRHLTWGRWLRAWPDWRLRSLATIPLDSSSASQPRASRPGSPGDEKDDQQSLLDRRESGSLDFDAFFLRYQRPLYTYLRRLLATDESAIDLTQETFFRVWTHFEQVRGYQRPEAWLFRVATNLALSQLRRHEPLSLSRLRRRDTDGPTTEDDQLLSEGMPDLAEMFAERDMIARSLRELPERQRAALLLRSAHGFSVEEVSQMLGTSVANMYQLLSRGARRFREIYEASQRESER